MSKVNVENALVLAQIIREVDGNHDLGAAALAEAILGHRDAPKIATAWNPIDSPPMQSGWYAGAMLPSNWEEDARSESCNEWRIQFGYTKVWFNPQPQR